MNGHKALKIQNIINFTDGSKKIDELELVREVNQLCSKVRLYGTKTTQVYYYKNKGEQPVYTTVEKLSIKHRAIIVTVRAIMGEDMKNDSRIFFGGGFGIVESILKEMHINFEIPRSVREFREKFIKTYCDTKQ